MSSMVDVYLALSRPPRVPSAGALRRCWSLVHDDTSLSRRHQSPGALYGTDLTSGSEAVSSRTSREITTQDE